MITDIKKNIETEFDILREISSDSNQLSLYPPEERKIILGSINALKKSMKIINGSIPGLLKEVSLAKKIPSNKKGKKKEDLEEVEFKRARKDINVTIKAKDRERLLKELSINEGLIKKIKKKDDREDVKVVEFKRARGYLKASNKLFLDSAKKMIAKGHFRPLSLEIKKANLNVLLEGYVAMMFFSILLSVFVGVFLWIALLFVNISPVWPIFSLFDGNYLIRAAQLLLIPILLPAATFIALYYYPSTEKGSLAKKIDRELPFAVIHMSAIAGSGIEPSKIFRIIGFSNEYKYLGGEVRKILNQINLYGYDLLTALNNVAKITPSKRLSELLGGLSTTVNSGGSLSDFFDKRAGTLLNSYRLEREKFTKTAETFMDIYISVVIAAPMVLLLLLVLISVSGIQIGLSASQITLLIIAIVALLNLIFIWILNIKQPSY